MYLRIGFVACIVYDYVSVSHHIYTLLLRAYTNFTLYRPKKHHRCVLYTLRAMSSTSLEHVLILLE